MALHDPPVETALAQAASLKTTRREKAGANRETSPVSDSCALISDRASNAS